MLFVARICEPVIDQLFALGGQRNSYDEKRTVLKSKIVKRDMSIVKKDATFSRYSANTSPVGLPGCYCTRCTGEPLVDFDLAEQFHERTPKQHGDSSAQTGRFQPGTQYGCMITTIYRPAVDYGRRGYGNEFGIGGGHALCRP